MQAFLEVAFPCEMLDEQTARIGLTLWAYKTTDFAAAFERFPDLIENEKGTDFDMILLNKLELGEIYVVHAERALPPGVLRFRNEKAKLVQCDCGCYRIECSNPSIQKCCK